MSSNITHFPIDEISYAEAYAAHHKEKITREMKGKASEPRPAAGQPSHTPLPHRPAVAGPSGSSIPRKPVEAINTVPRRPVGATYTGGSIPRKPVGPTRPPPDLNKPLPPSPPNKHSRERPNLGINTNAAAAAAAAARKHAEPGFVDPFSSKPLDHQNSPPSPSGSSSPLKRIGSWFSRRGSTASQSSTKSPAMERFKYEFKKEMDEIADGTAYFRSELKREVTEVKEGVMIGTQMAARGAKKVVAKIETVVDERKTKQREKEAERRMRIAREVEDEIAEAHRQADEARHENAARADNETVQREAKRAERERRRQEAIARNKKPVDESSAAKVTDSLRVTADAAPAGMMEACSVCGQVPHGVLTHGRCSNCGQKEPAKSPSEHLLIRAPAGSVPAFSNVLSTTPSAPRSLVDDLVNERLRNVSSRKPAFINADNRTSFAADVSSAPGPPSPLIPYTAPSNVPRPPSPLMLYTSPSRVPRTAASSVHSRASDDEKPFHRSGDRVPPVPILPLLMHSNLDELMEAEEKRRAGMPSNPAASSVYSRAPDSDKPFVKAGQRVPTPFKVAARSVYSRAPEDDKPFLRPGERRPPMPPMSEESLLLPNPATSSVYSRAPEDNKPYRRRPKTTKLEKDIRDEIFAAIDETRNEYNICGTTMSTPRPVPSELPTRPSSPPSPPTPKSNFF